MTVVREHQDSLVAFRANEALISAVAERARASGCTLSEYIWASLRVRVRR